MVVCIPLLAGCGGDDGPTGSSTGPGSIIVSATTSGDTLDANGYTLKLDNTDSLTVESNGSITFEEVDAGNHELAITGVQVNCAPEGGALQAIQVGAGETVTVNLKVACRVALFNHIVFHREASEEDFDLFAITPDDSEETVIRDSNGADLFASLSPDGTRVAFQDQSGEDSEIAVMNIDGSGYTRLTDNDAFDGSIPAWSPDGSQIAFSSYRDGDSEIYVMTADGSGVEQLTENEVFDAGPDWSPDGNQIVFHSGPADNRHIYVMDADGSNIVQLTDDSASERSPVWAPDGDHIAFERSTNIYMMNADGTDVRQLTTENGQSPSWSPDGSQIVFESDRNGDSEIFITDTDGESGLINLTNSPATEDRFPTWGPSRTEDL